MILYRAGLDLDDLTLVPVLKISYRVGLKIDPMRAFQCVGSEFREIACNVYHGTLALALQVVRFV